MRFGKKLLLVAHEKTNCQENTTSIVFVFFLYKKIKERIITRPRNKAAQTFPGFQKKLFRKSIPQKSEFYNRFLKRFASVFLREETLSENLCPSSGLRAHRLKNLSAQGLNSKHWEYPPTTRIVSIKSKPSQISFSAKVFSRGNVIFLDGVRTK